jgi:DNA (cytosine-5)-methyltransferase 1
MTHASLFSGIGGFDLAAQWMGWDNLFHCEWNPFCQHHLKYYWPNAITYTDINTTDFTIWRGRIDILTGGFPCQPFSTAGQRKGTHDDRYLWPQMLRCIREVQPRWVVGENVDGIFTWSDGMVFETVCLDLENEGYEVQALRIPACATGAPHRRDRWWFIAHCEGQRTGCDAYATNPNLRHRPETEIRPRGHKPTDGAELAAHPRRSHAQNGLHGQQPGRQTSEHRDSIAGGDRWSEHWLEAAARLCILDDGLPGRLDAEALSCNPRNAAGKWRKESLKAAGNAIVPGIAHAIFQAIAHAETSH